MAGRHLLALAGASGSRYSDREYAHNLVHAPGPIPAGGLAARAAPDAWERFVRLYTPLLPTWARRPGVQEADAEDLVQEALLKLVREFSPRFGGRGSGDFDT